MKQIVHLMAAIKYQHDKLKSAHNITKPITVLCGDLNSAPESSIIEFISTGEVNLDNVKALEVAAQPIAPNNYYKYKHGQVGSRPIDRQFLHGTGLTRNSMYGEASPLERDESNALTHQLHLKW